MNIWEFLVRKVGSDAAAAIYVYAFPCSMEDTLYFIHWLVDTHRMKGNYYHSFYLLGSSEAIRNDKTGSLCKGTLRYSLHREYVYKAYISGKEPILIENKNEYVRELCKKFIGAET